MLAGQEHRDLLYVCRPNIIWSFCQEYGLVVRSPRRQSGRTRYISFGFDWGLKGQKKVQKNVFFSISHFYCSSKRNSIIDTKKHPLCLGNITNLNVQPDPQEPEKLWTAETLSKCFYHGWGSYKNRRRCFCTQLLSIKSFFFWSILLFLKNTVKIWIREPACCSNKFPTFLPGQTKRHNSILQLGSIMQEKRFFERFWREKSEKWEEILVQTKYLRYYKGRGVGSIGLNSCCLWYKQTNLRKRGNRCTD